ncbi:MAG: hypothetical protein ACI8PZ_002285 [Myxococcota bacterium]|jgi:hypothetical protein
MPADAPVADFLSPVEHAVRASMAIRGIRPSPDELASVHADPSRLPSLVDTWLHDPRFGDTIKDLHAEALLLRTDVLDQLPVLGPLESSSVGAIHRATTEAPLRMVERVVLEDRPYTEIVTADWVLADPVLATIYGLPYDPAGPEWQPSRWSDGRPMAGLLSESELYRRVESAGSNFHRLRANYIADTFLCADFAGRDIAIDGGIDLTDEALVAQAVFTNPSCVGCHQALDPLAAFFWGFKVQVKQFGVTKAYLSDCRDIQLDTSPYLASQFCYPLEHWTASDESGWSEMGLRPPGYYGEPATDLSDLGRLMAEDPRFSACTARRFQGYLGQLDKNDVAFDVAAELQDVLIESGFSARELVRHIVLSDRFRRVNGDDVVGLLTVRPEQYARMLEDWTGWAWRGIGDPENCATSRPLVGSICWGEVDLLRSDRFGFRTLAGGVDGFYNTTPTHDPTPMRELVLSRVAFEAAGFVVPRDLSEPDPGARRLLTQVEADTTDEPTIRAQLADLHVRILGTLAEPDDAAVDASWALWSDTLAVHGSPTVAWQLTLGALLQDPRVMFY